MKKISSLNVQLVEMHRARSGNLHIMLTVMGGQGSGRKGMRFESIRVSPNKSLF